MLNRMRLQGESAPFLGIPREREIYGEYERYSGTNGFGAVEFYQVTNAEVQARHSTSPKSPILDDSVMPQQATYPRDIYPFLKRLSANDVEKEKRIAQYLIRYSKTHQTVILEELRYLYTIANKNDVDKFNQSAVWIMEKAQARYSVTDKSYQLGMSVAQARALRIL